MGNLLEGAKVGDVVYTPSRSQWFFVHAINEYTMTMSGFAILYNGCLDCVFHKCSGFIVDKIADEDERTWFFDKIMELGLKLDRNKGISMCYDNRV
jgi:hypothetical protein